MSEQCIRVAINGYGRIGRCILRALYEGPYRENIQIVAINDPAHISAMEHLTRFDSTHGTFAANVSVCGNVLSVNGDEIQVYRTPDIHALNWAEENVDIVFECSGCLAERKFGQLHLDRGAGKVLFSSPATSDVDATIVYGFNENSLQKSHRIVSNASCTTNCSAHIIQELDSSFGIECGVISIIHSSMNDQPVIDGYHDPDLRKNRSSSTSIIPVSTGLARGIERLFPHMASRLEAVSLRVPTTNVSLMQLSVHLGRKTDVAEVNAIFQNKAREQLPGILGYTEQPLVSCDFNHTVCSAVVDGSQTLVSGGKMLTVMAWFDNEWAFANRMLDTAKAMMGC